MSRSILAGLVALVCLSSCGGKRGGAAKEVEPAIDWPDGGRSQLLNRDAAVPDAGRAAGDR